MTREEVKEMLPILQAYIDGKTIQWYDWMEEAWKDAESPNFALNTHKYRVKPGIKHVPFTSNEDCLREMRNHQPFGWILDKSGNPCNTLGIFSNSICTLDCNLKNDIYNYNTAFKYFNFFDGSPFGKLEEK